MSGYLRTLTEEDYDEMGIDFTTSGFREAIYGWPRSYGLVYEF